MFIIWGFSSGTKEFPFMQTLICKACGQFGRLNLFMSYRTFTLFFIPIIKFSKQYYIQMSCCGTVYAIDAHLAKALIRGEKTELAEEDLTQVVRPGQKPVKHCPSCGAKMDAESAFCPKCGTKL